MSKSVEKRLTAQRQTPATPAAKRDASRLASIAAKPAPKPLPKPKARR